ncbi:tight junction protein ZO-1 isoform X4 [Ischnura elegans]|uniref:tight junction protein ZO-1 isoform X4 n=1 Tax=Ischnura elegans TaxID=197161 RepID=UPI001ED87C1A|nr:tight junction protein ZO-1 isoform X4 [Ischnura elegans]
MLTIPKSVCFRKCGSLCAFVILAFVSGSSLWWYQNILLRSRKPSEIPSVRIICPTRDIITAHKHGRLGNLVWTYASTVAIGHFLNLSPYLPSALLSELEKVFLDISVPAYEETILSGQCRRLYDGDPVRCLTGNTGPTEENISPWNILCRKVKKGTAISDQVAIKPVGELKEMRDRGLFGDVLMLPLYIIHTQAISVYGADRFRELFRFRPEILDLARKTIHGVLSVADERVKGGEVSFVGVHVRRTDYSNHIKNVFDKNATVVNAEYYQRAMRKMTDEYNVGKTVLFMVGDRVGWEFHTVTLSRVPGYGFGIAVSGGRDNPHFANGDPAIAISDVLKAGPAEGKLLVNDRILSANGVSLEGVDYGTAVAVLRESGQTVTLSVKRRVLMSPQQQGGSNAMQQMQMVPPMPHHHHQPQRGGHQYHAQSSSLPASTSTHNGSSQLLRQANSSSGGGVMVHQQQTLKLSLAKTKKKDDFGLVLGCKIYIREVGSAAAAAVSVEDVDTIDVEDGSGEGTCGGGMGLGSPGVVPPSLQEGDVLVKINGHTTEGMSLKEARKALEGAKGERVSLVVKREVAGMAPSQTELQSQPGFIDASSSDLAHHHGHSSHQSGPHHRSPYPASQNLYVQPPTRSSAHQTPSQQPAVDDKGGSMGPPGTSSRGGRSRGPLVDSWALGQLDGSREGMEGEVAPPRPPPPRPEDYYSSRRQLYEDDPLLQRSKQPVPDPRFITFQKEGSVGIRLTGGNEVGIFVTAVQPGSPASLQGLQPGDKILKVNGMEMKGITREEAVLLLLGLQEQVQLIVQYRKDEYDQVVASQRGDSFHVKTHFNYDHPNKGELCFRKGDVFHVVDTLHNGVVGAWQVYRIGRNNQEVQKGTIPNKSRAEELATAQFNAAKKDGGGGTSSANEGGGGRVGFFRRRRGSHRRSKSLGRDHWDDVVFGESYSSASLASKFPAYERVSLRHPGFVRPVVLFGPLSDVARDKMLADFPDRFTTPQLEAQLAAAASGKGGSPHGVNSSSGRSGGIIRLSSIRDIVERGKHALLDVTPAAVERLNYARFYPIVLFLRADSKHVIKELRAGVSKSRLDFFKWTAHKSSKKLLDQSQRVERAWSHVFTASVPLATPSTDSWYRRVRETIDRQQASPLWISEAKPDESLSDDFLFPMTSRLSYASSPESDLDLCPDPASTSSPLAPSQQQGVQPGAASTGVVHHGFGPLRGSAALKKSNSDPSIATHEEDEDTVRGLSGNGITRDSAAAAGEDDLGDDGDAPGYNAPPPYSPFKMSHHHGHSSGHTSQSASRRSGQQNRHGQNMHQQHPSVDCYGSNLRVSGNGNDFVSPQQQRHCSPLLAHSPPHSPSGGSSRNPAVPDLPPRVDRTNKPGRSPSTLRSATERLFGGGSNSRGVGVGASANQSSAIDNGGFGHQQQYHSDGNYMNAQRGVAAGSSLERPTTKGVRKPSGHDSMSSSYDSFNRIGPNAHDDLKSGNGTTNGAPSSMGSMQRLHDPYRFTRSTAQPIREGQPSSPTTTNNMMDYSGKYSREHRSKPGPPPPATNSGSIPYKPVPPPKPKNYRPPQQPQNHENAFWGGGGGGNHLPHPPPPPPPSHSRSYSAHIPNGGSSRDGGSEDLDSGVTPGGSLERNHVGSSGEPPYPQPPYGGGTHSHLHMQQQRSSPMAKPPRGQFYYNVPPPREYPPPHPNHHHHHHHSNGGGPGVPDSREISGLDLTNREQRGSAFELYKKPNDPRLLFVEHGAMRGQNSDWETESESRGLEEEGLRKSGSGANSIGNRDLSPSHSFRGGGVNGLNSHSTTGGNGSGDVLASAEGVFGCEGGRLDCGNNLGVSLVIPPGALPEGSSQRIYLRVSRGDGGGANLNGLVKEGDEGDTNVLPPLDTDKGETILSPLVFCGPQGLRFQKPVELILPHSPANAVGMVPAASSPPSSPSLLHLSLRASQTKSGKPMAWKNVDLGERLLMAEENGVISRGSGQVSVLVDHF